MSLAMPVLAKAAAFGALIGVGAECAADFKSEGTFFAISVIASVALRAVAYFFSVGAAVGMAIGFIGCLIHHSQFEFRDLSAAKLLGCVLLGTTLGYVLEPAFTGINWVVYV